MANGKSKKEKLAKVVGGKQTRGFISPMAQYLKYGDWDPSEVSTGTLQHRGEAYNPDDITKIAYGGLARGQGFKAFRHGGKLYHTEGSYAEKGV